MTVRIGTGAYTYEVAQDWARLPDGWAWGDVGGVAVDSQNRVYAFNRGPHPMIVFDLDGNFLHSWGEGVFPHAHGLQITADDVVYCTDDGDHTVRRCTLDGEVLLEIGTPGRPAAYMSGNPFRRCTHTALSPTGDIYVSDGYENNVVHRYSAEGTLLSSFGSPGVGPGEFNLPHALWFDHDSGRLLVVDRENHRVQIFDEDGKFRTEWRNLHRPTSILRIPGERPAWLIGEIGPVQRFNREAPNLGPRLSVLDDRGELITRLGVTPATGTGPGQFLSPHGIAMDSRGDIYVAQVSATVWAQLFPGQPAPARYPSLIKLVRVTA
jgi:hypothetical protein